MQRRTWPVVLGTLVVGLIAGLLLRSTGAIGPGARAAAPLPPPLTPEGENGLTPSERQAFYHLSEGGELYPLDWFLALEVETLGEGGAIETRPFMDNIERYGFLSDPKSPGNPAGVPVGVSVGRSRLSGAVMIGLNCAACHVGQIEYQRHAVRIDGGGNMVLVNKFLTDMGAETQRTLTSPRRLARFWSRVRAIRKARRDAHEEVPLDPDERLSRRLVGLFTSNRGLLEAKFADLRNLPTLKRSIDISVQEGYGRLDAFGIGRDELLGSIAGNSLPADAPVSLPHIWGLAFTGWLQWGSNTNSVMERNIGQALGVGAVFDRKTYRSSVNLENLRQMETFAYKLQPPQWPASFPAIDRERAARGEAHFKRWCAGCHEEWETDGLMRLYKLHSIDSAGTDPLVAIGFERPVKLADGSVKPFAYAAFDLISAIKRKAYEERQLDAAQIAAYEQRQIRRGPRWDPAFRATLLDAENWPDSRGRKVYRSKTLVGIWATAPYLHNGSVPTLYDLLLPAAERPVTFPTGQREYDPVKLGLQTDSSKFTLAVGLEPFTFDTRIAGNWNAGHEWSFYPQLTDEIRYELIEYLKTFNTPFDAPPAPTPSVIAEVLAASAAPPALMTAAPATPIPWGPLLAILALASGGLFLFIRSVSADAAKHGGTEAEDIRAITSGILQLQARLATDQDRPLRRGTHAKGRCVRGRFEVFDVRSAIADPELAARLAQGLFAKPGVYDAVVRFANGNSQVQSDRKGDVRACSFSVSLPPGVVSEEASRQDFTMNDARTFPINDAHAFAVAVQVANAPSPAKGVRSLRFADKMAFLRIIALAAVQTRPPRAPYQQTRYWSTVPYAHGAAEVMKYSAIPSPANPARPLDGTANCLQDEIVRHVTEDAHMSTFDFAIQLLDPSRMRHRWRRRPASYWVENASIDWKESQAPFHVVGRLTLLSRSVLSDAEAEAQYIDVTEHSTAASTPLGSINRARWAAEAASRQARQQQQPLPPEQQPPEQQPR